MMLVFTVNAESVKMLQRFTKHLFVIKRWKNGPNHWVCLLKCLSFFYILTHCTCWLTKPQLNYIDICRCEGKENSSISAFAK